MIKKSEIVSGYVWILGRHPSNEEVDWYYDAYANISADSSEEFKHSLILSEEFRVRRSYISRHSRKVSIDFRRPKIVFIHMEKCGGTTLHTMLSTQVEFPFICPERYDGLAEFTVNELMSYDLFSGHFDYQTCQSIPGEDVRIITMLREPKARLLSLFYFWKAHVPDPARDYRSLVGLARISTPEEFFSHPSVVRHQSIFNAMTGQLTRAKIPPDNRLPILDDDDPLCVNPEKQLDLAWHRLVTMAAFGITENHDKSRLLFNKTLGLSMTSIPPQQVLTELVKSHRELVPVTHTLMNDQLNKLLQDLTEIDCRLYRNAVGHFEATIC